MLSDMLVTEVRNAFSGNVNEKVKIYECEADMQEHRTGLEDSYILKDGKKMRYGYTTGSCAAAAAKAAAKMLLTKETVEEVALQTPKGILLHLLVEDVTRSDDFVQCAIRKDGGDDPDVTTGALVYAKVEKIRNKNEDKYAVSGLTEYENETELSTPQEPRCQILLDGGIGVGRVTKPGLYQQVGEAAINPVPRQMILSEVEAVCREAGYIGMLSVEISIPAGVELAKRTFNPRLGIEGGISVLGTSGIVIPMSEEALISSIHLEMRMHANNGAKYLVITPGNYGEIFSREQMKVDLTYSMKCSNYLGETLDMAAELGIEGILFISHIGKFIKVSGGIMNTHSKCADCRAELMAAQAMRAGVSGDVITQILESRTTEESIQILKKDGHLEETMRITADKIQFYLDHRTGGRIQTGTVIFSNAEGILAETATVPMLMERLKQQKKGEIR